MKLNELTPEVIATLNKENLKNYLTLALEELAKRKEQKSHKKEILLELMKQDGPMSIQEMADKMEISTKNISSLLTYLRKDEHQIHTDGQGRKYIAE